MSEITKSEFSKMAREHDGLIASASGLVEALSYRAEHIPIDHVWYELMYGARYIDIDASGPCWLSPNGNKIFVNCGTHLRFVEKCLGIEERVFERRWVKVSGYKDGNLMVLDYCFRSTKRQQDVIREVENACAQKFTTWN